MKRKPLVVVHVLNITNVFGRHYLLAQQTVLLGQATDAVVRLAHHADGTADGVHLGGAGHGAGVRVHIDQVQLHGGVILGMDDAVAGRAGRCDKSERQIRNQIIPMLLPAAQESSRKVRLCYDLLLIGNRIESFRQ